MEINILKNIPLQLTLIRLIVSPLFLPLVMVYLLPYNNMIINSVIALFFITLSITDFFDGYLARKHNQETMLGRALDPLADKFLFFSALIALVTLHKIYFYWAILFIGREFFIMGLRILALENNFDVPVSLIGKLKTFFQSLYITAAIMQNSYFQQPIVLGFYLEHIFLTCSLVFSLYSAYHYYLSFSKRFFSTLREKSLLE